MADSDFRVKNGIVVNTSFTANSTQVTLGTINSSSNGVVIATGSFSLGNASVNTVINPQTIVINGSTIANSTGANNAFNLGGVAAASYVNATQLSANLNNYTTTSSLTSNYPNNTQLSANLANYTTTSSLSTTYVSNAFVNTAIANYLPNYGGFVNAWSFTANSTGNVVIGTTVLNATALSVGGVLIANTSGAVNAIALGGQPAANFVNSSQLSANLSNYSNSATISSTLSNYVQNTFLTTNYTNASSLSTTYITNTAAYTAFAQNTTVWSTFAQNTAVLRLTGGTLTGVLTLNANLVINTSSRIIANGDFGANGQALLSNGSALYWGNVATTSGGGAIGNGTDSVFYVGGQTVNSSFTTNASLNYMSAGPITINEPAVVTITEGSRWTIV